MTVKFLLSYIAISISSISTVGFLADRQHRTLVAETLESDDVHFSADGIGNNTLVVASPSRVECDAAADYFSHGDGAPIIEREGFSAVECDGNSQKIDRLPKDTGVPSLSQF